MTTQATTTIVKKQVTETKLEVNTEYNYRMAGRKSLPTGPTGKQDFMQMSGMYTDQISFQVQ